MNYKNNFLIVLAILLGALMFISAASAADADISVSDAPSMNQATIDQSLNEVTYNDSSEKSLNAIPSDDVISVNAATKTTSFTYNETYNYNETTGLFDATITITLARSGIIKYAYSSGTIKVTLGEDSYNETITNGTSSSNPSEATVIIYGLDSGTHNYTVDYSGDDTFKPLNGSHSFTISLKDPDVGFSVTCPDSVYKGNTITIIGTINEDVGPEVGVYFRIDDGEWKEGTRTSTIVFGNRYITCDFETSDLAVGNHIVTVKYDGYGIYKNDSATKEITVNAKKDPQLTVTGLNDTYYLDETLAIEAVLSNDADKTTVSFKIDDGEWTNVTVQTKRISGSYKGYADFSKAISDLSLGDHNITVKYNGGSEYAVAEQTFEFNVALRDPNISVVVDNVTYGENATVVVTVPSDATGIVYATVDGVNWYNATINNGKANIIIPGLTGGNYTAFALYAGDDNYTIAFATDDFKVIRIDPEINVSVDDITYGENATVNVTLATDATGNVTIALDNGMNQTVEIINGTASATFSGLCAKYYHIEVYYPGDNNYWGMTVGTGFNVSQADPNISVVVDNVTYGENATVVVTVPRCYWYCYCCS